jgi:hypothetical protein
MPVRTPRRYAPADEVMNRTRNGGVQRERGGFGGRRRTGIKPTASSALVRLDGADVVVVVAKPTRGREGAQFMYCMIAEPMSSMRSNSLWFRLR